MTVKIRTTTIDDITDLAAIHVAGWEGAYGGLIDQDYIASQTIEKRTADWMEWLKDDAVDRLIAVDDDSGRAVGFVAYGPLRTAPAGMSKIRPLYSSEIYALYLLPDVWRQGVGSALIAQVAAHLKEKKHNSMCLWVLDKNKRACDFYQAKGGQRVGKKMVEFGPSKMKEVCYAWRDLSGIIKT